MPTTTLYSLRSSPTMPPYRCPRCHADQIRDGRAEPDDVELTCLACGLSETRPAAAPDFGAWQARWRGAPEGSPEAALAAVTAAPRDDAPRLAYADLLAAADPARAELIRLQVARGGGGPATVRERALLREHGAAWAAYLEPFARATTRPKPDPGWAFDRGFISWIRTDADVALGLGERLFQLAPIEHLDLIGDPPPGPLLGSPLLGRLRSLGLPGANLDDRDAIALANNAHLANLRWLDLRDNRIGVRGVSALAASPITRAIPLILLGGNPGDPSEQYSLDWDGSVADSWLPPFGDDLERAHGPIPWLRVPPAGSRPDRYRA